MGLTRLPITVGTYSLRTIIYMLRGIVLIIFLLLLSSIVYHRRIHGPNEIYEMIIIEVIRNIVGMFYLNNNG